MLLLSPFVLSGADTLSLSDFTPTLVTGTATVQPGSIRFGVPRCAGLTGVGTASISSISTSGSTTGTGKMYVSNTCTIVIQYPNYFTAVWSATGITAQPTVLPAIPIGAWWIADIGISSTASPSITSVTDKRSLIGVDGVVAGTGMIVDCTAGPCSLGIDTAVVPTLGGTNAFTGTQDFTAATIVPTKPSAWPPNGKSSYNDTSFLGFSSTPLAGLKHPFTIGTATFFIYAWFYLIAVDSSTGTYGTWGVYTTQTTTPYQPATKVCEATPVLLDTTQSALVNTWVKWTFASPCVLQPGFYYMVSASNYTTVTPQVLSYYSNVYQFERFNTNYTCYTNSAVSSGSGSSLAMSSSIASLSATWLASGSGCALAYFYIGNAPY